MASPAVFCLSLQLRPTASTSDPDKLTLEKQMHTVSGKIVRALPKSITDNRSQNANSELNGNNIILLRSSKSSTDGVGGHVLLRNDLVASSKTNLVLEDSSAEGKLTGQIFIQQNGLLQSVKRLGTPILLLNGNDNGNGHILIQTAGAEDATQAVEFSEEAAADNILVRALESLQENDVTVRTRTPGSLTPLSSGTKSLEKALNTMLVVPTCLLTSILLVALVSPGSPRGLQFLLSPHLASLKDPVMWAGAIHHMVGSLNIGLGGIVTIASTATFRNPMQLHCAIVNVSDFIFSILFTILVYALLGCMSFGLGLTMKEVTVMDYPVLYCKIPVAITQLVGSPDIWCFIFFFAVYIMTVRAQMMMVAAFLQTVYDFWPITMKYSMLSSLAASLIFFFSNLPLLTQNGTGIYTECVENYMVGPGMIVLTIFKSFTIVWFYGLTKFIDDLHFMLGFRPSVYLQITWFLMPIYLLFMLYLKTDTYIKQCENDISVLDMGHVLQWFLIVFPTTLVLTYAGIYALKNKKKYKQLLRPSPKWRLEDPVLEKSRRMFSAFSITKEQLYRQDRLRSVTHIYEDSDTSESEIYL